MTQEIAPEARKGWMSLLASAAEGRLVALFDTLEAQPDHDWLRAPETGGVMVRGRTGGTGAPFNLGEMTVTRCTLKIADGTVGHGYVQGRSKRQAELAAKLDAMMQTEAAAEVEDKILTPLRQEKAAARDARAAKAAATKVDFFTMVRGED
ncbi:MULTISPECIES: phosphonate C-P lyase system protein PhnG [Tritonibacter]|uniref:Alpha-D-ribose 1-methylphosphonate 5-triphosphate synthase subunit PhnG n=1 Tax=Tritonibacter scottomollicae TaxID=483013 RepID=A0A2T1AND6_TRISK|nr:phosphonate C-P lyase system protein PhnG [Tritonibacter scottomollicae]PRZ50093.1 alpha-D-ribose 1-methylphosphonate 5-triphosphate synthase subunit PhnG [Tritonibacter scottomollicae]WOI31771.1 phosphonate C-P lyase system protein PhnG [Tritonibacter scottomollicae]